LQNWKKPAVSGPHFISVWIPRLFDLSIMRQLQDEGFEVGYHFNTLDRCGGDFSKAIALFERELKMLREAEIKVETVCSHGDPRVKKVGYKVNNRNLS
jgi:hypothetical protein